MDSIYKKTILIVDDDIDFLLQMKPFVEASGFNVITSESLDEAARMLGEILPDLVVSDLMMEDFDAGFQLAYKIKNNNPGIPVIIVSNVANELGIKFSNAGPDDQDWIKADVILTKPVRPEQLLMEINRLINRSYQL